MRKDRPVKPERSLPRRLLRILGRTLLTIVIILLIVFFLIQTPFVQNIVREKAVIYLSRKLKTRVRIGGLSVGLFHSVKLTDVYLEDRQSDTLLSAGLIDVRVRMLALLHNHLDIGDVHLKDVTAKIRRGLPDSAFNFQFIVDAFAGPVSPLAAKPAGRPMKIDMKELDLDNVRFVYRDTVTSNNIAVLVGHSITQVDRIDLDRQRFDVKAIEMDKFAAHIVQGGRVVTDTRLGRLLTAGGRLDLNRHVFEAKTIQIDSTGLAYDDNTQKRQQAGMDYAHLGVSGLQFRMRDLKYTPDSITGKIDSASLDERSGFRLDRLQTVFYYSDHRAQLNNLLLATPGTFLQRSVSLRYDSLGGMVKDAAHTQVDLDLAGSRVKVSDILVFAPFLRSEAAFSHPGDVLLVNTRITGTFDDLDVHTLQFSGLRDIRLDLAGRVEHPFNMDRLNADLRIARLSGSGAAVLGLLPKGSMPSSIRFPDRFDLHGRLAGGMDSVRTDLVLVTSSGTAAVRGWARRFRNTAAASYDLDLRTNALQLGQLLRDSLQWGAVTAELKVKGQGLDLKSARATLHGRVASATIRQYTYTGMTLEGALAGQFVHLHSTINDEAVRFDLQGSADLAKRYPAVKVDWQIDTVDLLALHLTTDTLAFQGHLLADFSSVNPDSLQGRLALGGIGLVKGSHRYRTDSLVLTASNNAGMEDIRLHSEMADLDWDGRYKLTETAQALEHAINRYYALSGSGDTRYTEQDWKLRMQFRTSPLLLQLVPSLRGTDTVGGIMTFNGNRDNLQLRLQTPRLVVGDHFFHDLAIQAGTADSSLQYDISLADGHGSGLLLYKTAVYGAVKDNRVTTSLLLRDKNNTERYRLAGTASQQNGAIKFIFDPDSLMLNYDRWQVSKDNFIQYDSTGVIAHDLTISNQGDSLSLNSKGTTGAAPVDVRFGSFRLSTMSRLANQDSVIADGLLNGQAEVKNITTKPVFTSDLKIQNLKYKTDTLGDLTLKVNNERANTFTAEVGLQGKNNDIAITGDYYPGDSVNLKLDLRRMNLEAFTAATQGVMEKMRGALIGQMTIRGSFDKPTVRGNLYFDSAVITPAISGEALDVSKDRIAFDEDGFNFSEFTLRDSAGNKLIIDGNVFTKDYHSYGFDISLNAQNFRMVNAPENSSRQFYGQLNLDAAINLEGSLDAPAVDGTIRANKNTNFYYVLPGNDPEVGDRVGVVRFVDHRTGDTLVDKKALALRAGNKTIKGLDVSLNLLTDTSALLNVVIDPRSGDELNVRGQSNLVFQLEKSGKVDLTGSYEVNGGFYSMSFEVLKRKFSIDPGSVVTWTGDPTTATVNLTASYTALTPSIDLVSNVISDLPPAEQNKFQQKLPFLVTLRLDGDLLKPTITFDISLPTNVLSLWPDVDQRLTELRTQQSEMNEQVFALLLLNRFVGPDPLASREGGGSTVGNLAFSSASQILTNQMDQVAASLIKEVDIHFDLNNQQDWYTGTEIAYTELDVTVSKHLMEDRLRVSVGSSFDVVGTGAPNQAASNLAGTVDAAYKLTKDGRYLVRAYRQNQYEAVIQGQVIETGVGFIFTFNYDKFKEIWHHAKGESIEPAKTTNGSSTSSK
ncbi:MAG TPA: translocation/assembly module TamB domain-containing protein [Puia sp.]|nr:translocation/assembly module TamB domain-containing protein [Puia sp.]